MHRNCRSSIAAAMAALTIGCASQTAASPQSGSATTTAPAAAVGQRNVVLAAELATAGDVDLYDALNRLRPAFLRSRIGGGTTGTKEGVVSVYLDGIQMMEGLPQLREIATKNVQEVRFLEPQQANARFGGTTSGGALVITTKK